MSSISRSGLIPLFVSLLSFAAMAQAAESVAAALEETSAHSLFFTPADNENPSRMKNPSLRAKWLVNAGKQQVEIENFFAPPPGPGEVLIRAALSFMSTGTENIVSNRFFDPGTHWDNGMVVNHHNASDPLSEQILRGSWRPANI